MSKKSIWAVFLLFSTMAATGLFLKSSFFSIRQIEVRATSPGVKAQIEHELGTLRGENLWELELDDLAVGLQNKFKVVQAISFQRHWPSALIVQVEERVGVAIVFIEQDLWTIDRDGIPFAKSAQDLPLFWPLPTDKKIFLQALRWMEETRPAEVNGLTWDREMGLTVLTNKKARVILGRQNFSENWRKARDSIEFLNTRGIQAKKIDATYNKRAVVSL